MEQVFLHLDMDAFFAAVEQRDNPSLIGKPVIIGPNPHKGEMRGVVSTCSYEARPYGVHSAMPVSQAFKLCPHGIYLHGNFKKYNHVSSQLFEIMRSFSPIIEPLSLDEAFLDITGSQELFGKPELIAEKLKQDVFEKLNLTCSIGVSTVKFIAKIASDFRKPNGITIVQAKDIQSFLDQLELKRLWGVGKRSLSQLNQLGLKTVYDLRTYPQKSLIRLFGKPGQHFINLSNGIDNRGVQTERGRKSISKERTFEIDTDNIEILKKVIYNLSEELTELVRSTGFMGHTLGLKLRETGFITHNRQVTIDHPIQHAVELYMAIEKLLNEFLPLKKKIRLIGISIRSQKKKDGQLDFFHNPKLDHLDKAKDHLNKKFGQSTIKGAEGL